MKTDLELIALVNEEDDITGYAEKLEVHKTGLLHRAFSVFVLNNNNELLLQRRSFNKYHSGGLWTNTCCSHMFRDEDFNKSVHRRLKEEMGFDCELQFAFKFRYDVAFKNGLFENELDHVYIGYFNGNPKPNPMEACDWKWASLDELRKDIILNEDLYTYWFKIAFKGLLCQLELPVDC
jgi:isopentenyl-diphosphate delta-isomerase